MQQDVNPAAFTGAPTGAHTAAHTAADLPPDRSVQPRALLLTDVVDSTALSERLGDAAMAAIWAAHDRVARDLLPPWRGREIDKTDGMLLLFDAVADAAQYALAYQRALSQLPVPLQARAGLHLAPVLLRENNAADVARGAKPLEVDGVAKPTVARVMSMACGGQLLLTPEAQTALADTPAAVGTARSHGHWALKGLAAPLEVFELCDRDQLPQSPAENDKAHRVVRSGERWLPVAEMPNNLPHAATSFVGRERELDELKSWLQRARLLTLLGMGGLGKTRLSLQVAAETRHLYPDGCWFIDLSPLRDATLVPAEVAQVLGLREEPERPLLQTLAAHLKRQRVLLILDNCEHLLDAAAELADTLLRAAPGLRMMASSREPLDVPGEQSYPILPLPVPGRGDDLASLQRSAAVQLFMARAQSHRPDFILDAAQAAPVAELVARLEGIPLAIELAAARLRTLEVDEINAGLAKRYEMLTGGSRRLQARQQTLRALVDWSYDLLQPHEQAVLQRLGVCVGGFDGAAAVALCADLPAGAGAGAINGGESDSKNGSEIRKHSGKEIGSQTSDGNGAATVAVVASLAEKSLLMSQPGSTPARWRMLESIRDHALDKLAAAGGQADIEARHNAHFFTLAKQGRDGLKGAQQSIWIARLETDLDNLRAATRTALDGGVDPVIAVKLATALQGFWILRGYASEGRAVVQTALALPGVRASPLVHGHALYVAAALAGSQSDHAEARALLQQCLALRREGGDPVQIAATLSTLAQSEIASGDAGAALVHESEALSLFAAAGDALGEAIGHLHLAQCHRHRGDVGDSRIALARALSLAREVHSHEIEGEAHRVAAALALDEGDAAGARAAAVAALAVAETAADRRGAADAQRLFAAAALAGGDSAAAHAALARALPELARHIELQRKNIQSQRVKCQPLGGASRGRKVVQLDPGRQHLRTA